MKGCGQIGPVVGFLANNMYFVLSFGLHALYFTFEVNNYNIKSLFCACLSSA